MSRRAGKRKPTGHTLAVAMIVKDEEASLPRALSSIGKLAKELVVVDTGSTDATKRIASDFGAKVFDFQWCDDFSAARNFALDVCTAEWILQLDADEELVGGKKDIPQLLARRDKLIYEVRVIVPSPDHVAKPAESFVAYRLFRRRRDIRYVNRIHEQIEAPDEILRDGAAVGASPVVISHFGPLLDSGQDWKRRTDRNIRLLQRAITDEPENGYFHAMLGSEYERTGELDSALKHFRSALQYSEPERPYVPRLISQTASCLFRGGCTEEALLLLRNAQQQYKGYTDLYFLEAVFLRGLGEFEQARTALRTCIQMGDPPEYYDSIGGTGSWRAERELLALESGAGHSRFRNG